MSYLLQRLKAAHKIGDYTLTSGIKSDFYIDVKDLMFDPVTLYSIAKFIYESIIDKWGTEISSVGGMELGSVPLSSAVSTYSMTRSHKLNHFVVRKAKRTHGTCSQIEGLKYMEGQSVVLLDDVLTTGGSLLKTYSIVSEFAKVKGAIVVVNREDIDVSTLPINIISLYTRSHILEAT